MEADEVFVNSRGKEPRMQYVDLFLWQKSRPKAAEPVDENREVGRSNLFL